MTLAAAVPPATRSSRWHRVRAPLTTAAVLGLATAALRLRDPHGHGSWGLCPFKVITGWDCPLCGGLRGVNDLSYGRLGDAWHSNALLVSALPLIAAIWLAWFAGSWTGRGGPASPRTGHRVALAVLVIALVFGVYRNTPWGQAFHVS